MRKGTPPPIIAPCYFGVDMKTKDDFIANNNSIEDITNGPAFSTPLDPAVEYLLTCWCSSMSLIVSSSLLLVESEKTGCNLS